MSAQSTVFNPSQTTSAATGEGFSVPRLGTATRLAINFTALDKGMMVYDVTLNNLFIWNGSAWESVPASGDAGADGSVQYNDNGVVSGAANLQYNKASGYTSLRSGSALRAYVADNSVYSTISDRGATGGLTIDNLNADGISLRIASTDVLNVNAGIVQVTGSATVTGDFSVRTNKLQVTSTGVGVGMTPITPLSGVIGTSGAVFFRTTDPAASVATPYIQAPVSTGYSSTAPVYGFWYQGCGMGNPASETLNWILASSEKMRLSSTGLGLGLDPTVAFDVLNVTPQIRLRGTGTTSEVRVNSSYGGAALGAIGTVGAHPFMIYTSNTQALTVDASQNVGIGISTFGTSAAKVLSIVTGTEPTTGPAGSVQFFTSTRSANNTIPAIFTEGSGVTNAAITNTTVTNKIAIKVNGTIYYLLATTSAA